ncbi:hypothetical protein M3Y99_01683200 [Aphelenchoides fujianensis]|nr:hypothetical protein M3Y99_01683200 [Aphelenchoides fujianensis]
MNASIARQFALMDAEESPDSRSILRSLLFAMSETRDPLFRERCFEIMGVDSAEDFVEETRKRLAKFLDDQDAQSIASLNVSALITSVRSPH